MRIHWGRWTLLRQRIAGASVPRASHLARPTAQRTARVAIQIGNVGVNDAVTINDPVFLRSQVSGYFFARRRRLELPDAASAHRMALGALSDAARDAVIEGSTDQLFAVEVRDEIGPVLEVTAFFSSRIFRKQ
jgi:hypothetical protein